MSCFDNSVHIPDVPCDDCELTKEAILESLNMSELTATLTLTNGATVDRIIIGEELL